MEPEVVTPAASTTGAAPVPPHSNGHALEVAASTAIDTSPPAVIARALALGTPVADLKELMAMQERWEANQARKAFVAAMARAKAKPPEILKDKHVSFQTSKGTTEYDHASHGNVTLTIAQWLAEFGFSHRWETKQEPNKITVTCILTHELGHHESVTLFCSHDDSGGKNAIQALVSAKTYLERHTLLAASGMSTLDQEDDDGGGAGAGGNAKLTEEHQAILHDTCLELGPKILSNVLREYKAEKLGDIPDSEFATIQTILAKMKAKRESSAK